MLRISYTKSQIYTSRETLEVFLLSKKTFMKNVQNQHNYIHVT